jgi:hypothetical protein
VNNLINNLIKKEMKREKSELSFAKISKIRAKKKRNYERQAEVYHETMKVLKWVVASGVGGFALASLIDLLPMLEISTNAKLMFGYFLNVFAFALKEIHKKSVG